MTSQKLPPEVHEFFNQHPDTDSFDILLSDMHGIQRGKQVNRSGFEKLYKGGMNFPLGFYFLDVRSEVVEEDGMPGVGDGDPDALVVAVEDTLAPVPWSPIPRGQVLATMIERDGTPFFGEPRNVLKHALQPLTDMGLTPVAAIELEFYLLKPGTQAPVPADPPNGMPAHSGAQVYNLDLVEDFGDFFREVDAACQLHNIPAATAITEYGAGQFEINLYHTDDLVRACDQAFLLKRIIRSIAQSHGMVASFMAKPFADTAGSGLHVHMSLLDKDGHNIFMEDGPTDGLSNFNDTLIHAIGGLSETMAEGMAIFSPNANSYRRYQPGLFVPVEPNWGPNHRDLSLRIPLSDAKNRRIEHRVAGADANPYLVAAAIVAGIHYGITHKCDPGPMRAERERFDLKPKLPLRWEAALDLFDTAQVLPKYLGEKYAALFARARRNESERFHAEVSDRDYAWYLRSF